LRYAASFDRARSRLASGVTAWREACPLGAGAVAGSSIPLNRAVQAKGLGFTGVALNALDATSTRDECLDFLFSAAQVGLHLQSLATDVIAFSQTPFQFTAYPAAFGTGSSMMPNKTNPDAMELLRGEANALLAAPQHALLILGGLPSGYNRDLQCIKPLVRDTSEKLSDLLAMTASFVAALGWQEDRLAQACQQGAIDATLRMEQKVREGMPLRDAHHAVAEDLAGGAPGQVSVHDYRTLGSASPEQVEQIARQYLRASE
jgi:argininosuccinate lyase